MVVIRVNRPARDTTMTLVTSKGLRVSMYTTPAELNYSHNARFGEIEREGRKALTRMTGEGLKTLSFSHRVASLDYTASIEPVLKRLLERAEVGDKIRFTGGSPELEQSAWWHIRNLGTKVVQRALNNQPSRVELSWELVEAVDVTADIVKTKPKPRKPPAKSTPVGSVTRVHRVVRGDTLWWISSRYLGDPLRYPEIVRANRGLIKNPNLILVGWKLKIPGR